jgi:hypothetical protein
VGRQRFSSGLVVRPRLWQINAGSGLALLSDFQLGMGTKRALAGRICFIAKVIAFNTETS